MHGKFSTSLQATDMIVGAMCAAQKEMLNREAEEELAK